MVGINMFDISVIIVNYKMQEQVNRCLRSLYADIEKTTLKVNVVVVDNGSKDGSGGYLTSKYRKLQFIEQSENLGFGKAQNIGMNSAEAKYYFVLNPDTYFYPEGNVVQKMFDFMEAEPRVGIIGPKIFYPDGSLQYSCYRFPTLLHPFFSRTRIGNKNGKSARDYLTMKDYDHEDARPVDWLMGSALFIRGKALREVGKFDERFWMYYEDSDLCRRFWEAGWGVYYVPSVQIEHTHTRKSAEVSGVFLPLLKNKYARIHVASWLKYMWKWRGNHKYYRAKHSVI